MCLKFFNYLIILSSLTYPIFGLDNHIIWIKPSHPAPIYFTNYIKNNTEVISTDNYGFFKIWNLDSNRIDDFYKGSDRPTKVFPTNDSSIILLQSDNQFSLLNIDGNMIKSKTFNSGILSNDISINCELIVTSYFYKNFYGGKDPSVEYGCGVEIWDYKNDSLWFIKQTYKIGQIGDVALPTIFDRYVSFSSDGKILAVSNDSGYVNFYHVSDSKFLSSIKINIDTITSMCFNNDILIISDIHGIIRAWDYQTGKKLYEFNKFQNIKTSLIKFNFHDSYNKYLITYYNPSNDSNDIVYLWDSDKNYFDDSVKIDTRNIKYYTISNDFKKLLYITKTDELKEKRLFDSNSEYIITKTNGSINSIDCNDSLVIAAFSNRDIKIYLISNGEVKYLIRDTSGEPGIVLITKDGNKIYYSVPNIIKKWDINRNQEDFRIFMNYNFTSMILNKTETILFSTQITGENCPWETNTGNLAYDCFFHHFFRLTYSGNICISPNDDKLAFSVSDGGIFYHVNISKVPGYTYKSLNIYDQDAAVTKSYFLDNDKLIFGNSYGEIQIWKIGNSNDEDELLKTFFAHEKDVTGIIFNNDSTVMISSGIDGFGRFWNPYNYQNVCSFKIKTQIKAIKSVNNTSLLISTDDGNLIMYDIEEYIKATKESSTLDTEISNLFFKIYPNPVYDIANIQYDFPITTQIKIEIIDLLGTTIKRMILDNTDQGKNLFNLDLSDIGPGFYIAKMTLNNKEQNFIILKFIKN